MPFFINVYTTSLLKSSLCLPLRYLWANDYKGKGISMRDHYIFCSRMMVGTACTAKFSQILIYLVLRRENLTLQNKNGAVLRVYEINVMT